MCALPMRLIEVEAIIAFRVRICCAYGKEPAWGTQRTDQLSQARALAGSSWRQICTTLSSAFCPTSCRRWRRRPKRFNRRFRHAGRQAGHPLFPVRADMIFELPLSCTPRERLSWPRRASMMRGCRRCWTTWPSTRSLSRRQFASHEQRPSQGSPAPDAAVVNALAFGCGHMQKGQ